MNKLAQNNENKMYNFRTKWGEIINNSEWNEERAKNIWENAKSSGTSKYQQGIRFIKYHIKILTDIKSDINKNLNQVQELRNNKSKHLLYSTNNTKYLIKSGMNHEVINKVQLLRKKELDELDRELFWMNEANEIIDKSVESATKIINSFDQQQIIRNCRLDALNYENSIQVLPKNVIVCA